MTRTNASRRDFVRLMALGAAGATFAPSGWFAQQPRRFVIDSHQHYIAAPDYIERLVKVYRPRNAMACVLTPISGLEVVKKAAADHPDVVIPYGHVNVDEPGVVREIQRFADAVYAFEKLVFGTDEAPENLDACIARYEAMLNACDVPEASRKKIYGETLAKILGIKVRA